MRGETKRFYLRRKLAQPALERTRVSGYSRFTMSGPTGRGLLQILAVTGGVIAVCLAVFVLYVLGYIHWRPPNFAVLTERNPQKLLAQADYLASLGNWQAARPYFA